MANRLFWHHWKKISRLLAAVVIAGIFLWTGSARPAGAGGSFRIHFLDVGQGDAALVECDGHAMLIDGGDRKQSSMIYSFLESHRVDHLDYMVNTPPRRPHRRPCRCPELRAGGPRVLPGSGL